MSRIAWEEITFLSSDSVCFEKEIHHLELETFSPKMLNVINCSELPPRKLDLKVGVM